MAAAGAAAVAVVGRRSEGVVSASGRSSGGVGVPGERVSPPVAGVGVTPEVSEDMVCDLRDSAGTVSSVSSGEGGSGGGAAGRAAGATAAFVRRSPPIAGRAAQRLVVEVGNNCVLALDPAPHLWILYALVALAPSVRSP